MAFFRKFYKRANSMRFATCTVNAKSTKRKEKIENGAAMGGYSTEKTKEASLEYDIDSQNVALEFKEEIGKVFASLPDAKFDFSYVDSEGNGTVVVRDLEASGTHTGAPFAFGPCEPIPASGKAVRCDREELRFTLEGGQISRFEIIAFGEMTGPQGFYTLLGGFPM